MAKTKICGQCSFEVPREARTCGHCGAQFVKVYNKSLWGRLVGAVQGLVAGGLLGAIGGAFIASESALEVVAISAAMVFGLLGFIFGSSKEVSR